ncbi:MAG TPA: NIPSNAP family protein [Hyphomicrobiaceae bacterium]|nr:NIPSNAP family protein [Hyphomicrobiaceae bacterium]
MIYEFRTYTLQPRTLPEFLKRFGEALPKRLEFSPLAAFWYTEIGPLNQVIHVWPYKDLNERAKTRAAAVKAGIWPPKTSEFITEMRSDILEALPFSPKLEPSSNGPWFEMRSYTLAAGGIPQMAAGWEKHLPGRTALSPLVGVFTSDIGGLNQWVHIWAYKSLDERVAVRKAAQEKGIWPPPPPSPTVKQETKILLAAPFSPIK